LAVHQIWKLRIFDVRKRSFRTVDLTDIADLYPGDPEPEYVDINDDNVAVVTFRCRSGQ
jgi:hypothetical protein